MRAHKPLHDLLLLAAGVSLLASASAQAQRRVVLPPGVKPTPTETARPKAEPVAKAAPADDEDEEEALPAPARKPTASPAATAPQPEPEPEKPRLLLPDDLAQTRPAAAAAAPAPSREVLYRKKVDKALISLRVRPAKPEPRRPAVLVFEIVQLLDVPDPAVGDRKPVAGGAFFAKVSLDGKSSHRYRLHPLKNAGAYGTHVTVPEAGVYRVALAQQLETREIGVDPIATEFLVGFGKETPMEVANDEEDDDAVQVRRGRRALRATRASAAPDLMTELGEHWMLLETALADNRATPGELEEHAKALAELSGKVQGHVPATRQDEAAEYDAIAAGLAPLSELPGQVHEPVSARETLRKAALDSCNRCHVKFRFGIADDLGRWPEFTPKAP